MTRYRQFITFLVAVLFSFPLVYQSLHRMGHVMSKSHCCAHHGNHSHEAFVADLPNHQHMPVITNLEEACPVCDYQHTAYNIPADLIVPGSLHHRFGLLTDGYQAPSLSVQARYLSLRAPPLM